jgi:hypothetical protein
VQHEVASTNLDEDVWDEVRNFKNWTFIKRNPVDERWLRQRVKTQATFVQHEVASINLDEDVWDEVRNFKKCLIKMWASEGREVLFLETAVQLQRQKRHCIIEAVPVPAGVASRQASLYFKKVRWFCESASASILVVLATWLRKTALSCTNQSGTRSKRF